MASPMKYPRDAVKALFKSVSPEVRESLSLTKVPRHLIDELAEIAYHGSFLTEEGRPTRFQIAVISSDRVGTGEHALLEETTVLNLDPRPLSIKEIQRLAPAADFMTTLICVDAMRYIPGVAGRGLEIWGLVSPGKSSRRLMRLESESAVHIPKCLVMTSAAPGHLQLALNIRPLVSLRAGHLTVFPRAPQSLPDPILKRLQSGSSRIADSLISSLPAGVDRAGSKENVRLKYVEVFCRLLTALSDTRHGLTMLFVPQTSIQSLEKILSIKYKASSKRLSLLFREIVAQTLKDDGKDDVSLNLDTNLSEALAVVASSSGVDGALVLTDQFEVIGFGAEIRILLGDRSLEFVNLSSGTSLKKLTRRSFSDFGTRHRSAARFCLASPDAVAFLVSHDGDRKLMTCVDEQVQVWADLAWDRLWEAIPSNIADESS